MVHKKTAMDSLNDLGRIERLERLRADLAEEVATGKSNTTRLASQNVAAAVLRELRPAAADDVDITIASGEICGRRQFKDNDESWVCLERAGHTGGHRYGPKVA